jgi:hypothetical protein
MDMEEHQKITTYGKPAVSYENIKIKRGVAQIHILTKQGEKLFKTFA